MPISRASASRGKPAVGSPQRRYAEPPMITAAPERLSMINVTGAAERHRRSGWWTSDCPVPSASTIKRGGAVRFVLDLGAWIATSRARTTGQRLVLAAATVVILLPGGCTNTHASSPEACRAAKDAISRLDEEVAGAVPVARIEQTFRAAISGDDIVNDEALHEPLLALDEIFTQASREALEPDEHRALAAARQDVSSSLADRCT